MKINPKAQEKLPVSLNILKSLRTFCIVILQHQVLPHVIAFEVFICIMDWTFTQPNAGKTTFLDLPCIAWHLIFSCPVVGKTILHQNSQQIHYYVRIATKLAKACVCYSRLIKHW